MDALVKSAELEVPKSLVAGEVERMVEQMRADLKKRGVKDAENGADPGRDVPGRRPSGACASAWSSPSWCAANNLQAKPEQLQAHIEELAQSYEKPAEVMRWYLSDRQRMAEVEAVVVENNVADLRARAAPRSTTRCCRSTS